MRGDRERLADILEAIGRIERFAPRGREAFQQDELLQTWAVHPYPIGEAARRVSEELKSAHPEVPWAQIVAMRHVLVHDYFRVDPDEVWATVERDLPTLKRQLQAVLRAWRSTP